jgi:hypothetical protein
MIEREMTLSPGLARPRACRAAMLEFDPVPQGERSARPGRSVVQVRSAPSGSVAAEHHIGQPVQRRDGRVQRGFDRRDPAPQLVHPGHGQLPGVFRRDGQADLRHVDQRIEHAAKAQVIAHRPPFRRVDHRILSRRQRQAACPA